MADEDIQVMGATEEDLRKQAITSPASVQNRNISGNGLILWAAMVPLCLRNTSRRYRGALADV